MQASAGRERGSTLVEYGLVVVLFFTLIFGIVDLARALYAYHFVTNAAREGSRYAMVRGGSWYPATCSTTTTPGCETSQDNVQAYVQSLASGIGINGSSVNVTATWQAPNYDLGSQVTNCSPSSSGTLDNPGCTVFVQVQYPFKFMLPFMPTGTSPCYRNSSGTPVTGSICMTSTSEMVISQ